jgi:hypothetical protein
MGRGHRYAVAPRDVTVTDGSSPEPTVTFRALRDGTVTDPDALEARRDGYEAMFTKLAAAGVECGSIQQAFWFVTASGDAVRGTLLAMRDDALTQVPKGGGSCTVTDVVAHPGDHIAYRVDGTFQSPLYMDDDQPPARVVRDDVGMPVFQGFVDIPFSVTVAEGMVEPGAEPGRPFGYGHGLMGL